MDSDGAPADGGLGIYVENLFTSYVEGFYLALIDQILGETDPETPRRTGAPRSSGV